MRSKYIPEASTLRTAAFILCALTNGNYTNVGFAYWWLVVRRVLIWEKSDFVVILDPVLRLSAFA